MDEGQTDIMDGQRKMDKRINNDLQKTTQKGKDRGSRILQRVSMFST